MVRREVVAYPYAGRYETRHSGGYIRDYSGAECTADEISVSGVSSHGSGRKSLA